MRIAWGRTEFAYVTDKEVRDTSVEFRNDQEDNRVSRNGCYEKLRWTHSMLTAKHRGDSNKQPGRDIARLSKSSNTNIDFGLVKPLLDLGAFPHLVEHIELVDTHLLGHIDRTLCLVHRIDISL